MGSFPVWNTARPYMRLHKYEFQVSSCDLGESLTLLSLDRMAPCGLRTIGCLKSCVINKDKALHFPNC